MMKKTWRFLLPLVIFTCLNASAAEVILDGPWRFELKTNYAVVPFVIELKWTGKRLSGILLNGYEKIPLNDIAYTKDEIFIPIQNYEVRLEMKIQNPKNLVGHFIRLNKTPVQKLNVVANQGIKHRFPGDKIRASIQLHGKWAINMTDEQGVVSKGVLLFYQKGNVINGSVLTPTGDYRYFDGFINDRNFEAASFDGVYNYYLKGKVIKGKLEATMLSNNVTKIEGALDANADLPDPYAQTQVSVLNFSFPDLKGKMVSLSDKKFQNKPVIVQIFGSWCPNCIDELNYLAPWYKANHQRGIEIVILAFERSLTPDDAKYQLLKTQARHEVPYPILIAGSTAEDKPKDKLPGLTNFISFPTTIYLNRKHEVTKVHAGFTGPSTGPFYERWKKEFAQAVDDLLK